MTRKTLPQPAKQTEQVKKYIEAFDRGTRIVVPSESGKWYFIGPNDLKSPAFNTKKDAVAQAKRELAKTEGRVFVLDTNGEVVNNHAPGGFFSLLRLKIRKMLPN